MSEETQANETNSEQPAAPSHGGGDSGGGNGGGGQAPDKGMAFVAYIIFFLPLLVGKRSDFVTFHTNQGTVLFIVAVAGNIVLGFIPILGWLLMPIFNIFILVLWIMGLLNVANGKKKQLPVIGGWTLIK